MKETYKKIYIILSCMIVIYMMFYTVINIFVYGSIMETNVLLFVVIMILPLYTGFKQKRYHKHTTIILSTYFLLILLMTYIILPNYTFKEAKSLVEQEGVEWQIHLKRSTDEPSFLYTGHYLVETNEGKYSVHLNKGIVKKLEEE